MHLLFALATNTAERIGLLYYNPCVILTISDVVFVSYSALMKKKSETETAARRLQQARDQFESRRQTLIGNENQMVHHQYIDISQELIWFIIPISPPKQQGASMALIFVLCAGGTGSRKDKGNC